MGSLKNRVKKLEWVIIGNPFVIPLLDVYTLSHLKAQIATYGISKTNLGQVVLIDSCHGVLAKIDYDPGNVKAFEDAIKKYQ